MTDKSEWVFVVDDDASIRTAVSRLLRSAGFHTETFSSAEAFLEYERPDAPSCLVLDVQLPQFNGLELQDILREGDHTLPIIFITGHGDIPMSVRAIRAGAVDFLPKPFVDDDLLRAVGRGIEQDRRDRRVRSDVSVIRQRFESLSPREREVLDYVVSGTLNKQIGYRLGVKEKTIKVHRGQVMRKMKAGSLAELVRMAETIGIRGSHIRRTRDYSTSGSQNEC